MQTSVTFPDLPEVFISYASDDEDLLDEFEPYITGLENRQIIQSWNGRKISPGEVWDTAINDHINAAQIILLLVSKAFLASKYCYGVEFKLALERHKIGAACVIPVILRTCNWKSTPVGQFQVLPRSGKAVSRWDDIEDAFVNITDGITEVVKELKVDVRPPRPPMQLETHAPVRRAVPTLKYAAGVAAFLIAFASLFLLLDHFPRDGGKVHIEVTKVPPYSEGGPNSRGDIAGAVSGARSPEFSLVIYSFTNAWYVQPRSDDYETRIQSDGSWSAAIQTGKRYAVL
ncbi:MAG TPA: toll/interleukin-1 receptor domain-containing protein, partial [Pyrinomonadaceae bacterium]|nr:toll/interleukin-1 receptor domain-containing protein [Pyrinomonadaceae bacterium]